MWPKKKTASGFLYLGQPSYVHSSQGYVRAEAYTTYVRPLFEYSSSVWYPHTQRNSNKIEAVQRRAAGVVLTY